MARRSAPPAPSSTNSADPVRIGGWLVRVAASASLTVKGESKQDNEQWTGLVATGTVIAQDPTPDNLLKIVQSSDVLSACIAAMAANIGGHGWEAVPRVPSETLTDAQRAEAEAERVVVERFFEYASHDDSWLSMRKKLRYDLEATGNAYLEVVRNPEGAVTGLEHIPALSMRLGPQDTFRVDAIAYETAEDGLTWIDVPYRRYFRKFVQLRRGQPKIFFREFGDPRGVNAETGAYTSESSALPEDKRANDVIHFRLYNPDGPYGLPRWYGAAYAAEGRRKAAIRNYTYFDNNAIPPALILVSGGTLGEGDPERVFEHFRAIQTANGTTGPLVLEAVPYQNPETLTPTGGGHVAIHVEKLNDVQEKDGTFGLYSDRCDADVAMTFRLPPILRGRATDYTRATAQTSLAVAEAQTFGPERADEDWIINRRLLPALGIRYWRHQTRAAKLDNDAVGTLLSSAGDAGALTPNLVRQIVGPIIGAALPTIEKPWGDVPFQITLALAGMGVDTVQTEVPAEAEQARAGEQVARGLLALRDALTREQKRRRRTR